MKGNVKTAMLLAFFAIVALICILYAFVQQTEAKRQATLARQIMQRNIELEQKLNVVLGETLRQRSLAEAEKLIAIKALEDCKSSQKKNKK